MPNIAPVLTSPLREGEHLTPDEFLHRWDAMPDLKRAELVDGIVHMPSPLSYIHGDFEPRLSGWLTFYRLFTPQCVLLGNVTTRMSHDSVPQPDLSLRIPAELGGQSRIEGEYPAGAPEFIVEVSHSTFARDSGVKQRLYERSGVREYLIVRPTKRQILWHELVNGKFQQIAPDPDGLYRSRIFPGLWLDPDALWNNDLKALYAVIERGAATEEHQAFLRKLASPAAKSTAK